MKDGGPAFPNPALANGAFCPQVDLTGMSLRDYIAAKVCASAYINATGLGEITQEQLDKANAAVARFAYAVADAMLEAREA